MAMRSLLKSVAISLLRFRKCRNLWLKVRHLYPPLQASKIKRQITVIFMASRRLKSNLILWAMCALAGASIGALYSQIIGGQVRHGATVGATLTASVFAIELFWVQGKYGIWMRALPLLIFTLLSTLIWACIIAINLRFVPVLLLGDSNPYGEENKFTTFQQDFMFSLAIAFLLNSVLRIRNLIGGRVFTNFMLGRYHRPLSENRIFLFLDLADSTALSEKLGDLKVQSLIGQFFFDIARPIAEHGGETHRYVGDEIVVTWPLRESNDNDSCIHCVFDIQSLIETRAEFYLKTYGVVPEFRVGLHGGRVVAGEVGDDKREIVYFGDTINTAARLQSLCKEKGRNFLISLELLRKSGLSGKIQLEEIGEVSLRGRHKPLMVYALAR
jgi:adenylate cyclase